MTDFSPSLMSVGLLFSKVLCAIVTPIPPATTKTPREKTSYKNP